MSLLAGDPRPARLTSDEPFARFVTMTAVLGMSEDEAEVRHTRQAVVADPRVRGRTVPTVPGDLLAIVSDGVTEVFDAHDDDFRLEGVEAALARHAREPLEVVAARVVESVRRHGPQTDDQTILLVRHLAGPAR